MLSANSRRAFKAAHRKGKVMTGVKACKLKNYQTMEIPKLKFKPGQIVFAYTKGGMKKTKIGSVHISIYETRIVIMYFLEVSTDCYYEDEIYPDMQMAKKQLASNANQLVLMLV